MRRLALLLVLASGCVPDRDEPDPPKGAPELPPAIATPIRASALRITSPSLLIPGPTAKGRVGDFKLTNEHVAVVIGDGAHAEGYAPYGGTILDAGPLHGPTRFGEILMTFDLKIVRPESIVITRDGQDGGPAVIEVRGREGRLPLLEALLPDYVLGAPRDLAMLVRYTLQPGAHHLDIDYELTEEGAVGSSVLFGIAGFLFGDGALPYVPGYGFASPKIGTSANHYGAVGADVGYLFGKPTGTLNFLYDYSGILAAQHSGEVDIPSGSTKRLRYALVIGPGDLTKLQDLWRDAIARDVTGAITGKIVDARGAPIVGALVHASESNPRDPERSYVTSARTSSAGTYALSVPRGAYDLVAVTPGGVATDTKTLRLDDMARPLTLDFVVASMGTLTFAVTDPNGAPIPAKITVLKDDGGRSRLPARFGEPEARDGIWFLEHSPHGRGVISLLPGAYTVHVSHGTESEIVTRRITITPGADAVLTAQLERTVDTRGWLASDTHLHSQLSSDSSDTFAFKVAALAAEGIEIPVSTEHEALGDFGPAIIELDLGREMKGIVGSEVTTSNIGHFNAFPLEPDLSLPGRGRLEWFGMEPGELFARIRGNPGDPIVQVNHPRWLGIGGYFNAMGFGASQKPELSFDFDTIEILNACDAASIDAQPIRDWMALLDLGERKVATGGSDSHHAGLGEVGYPRTYIKMPTDQPGDARIDDVRSAFRKGQVSVSCGPFIEMKVGAAEVGDEITVGASNVHVRVEAPSWMKVDKIEILANGRVVATRAITQQNAAIRFDAAIPLDLAAGWVVARVSGATALGPWANEGMPWAITNAIFVIDAP